MKQETIDNLEEVTNQYLEKLKEANNADLIATYTKAINETAGKLVEIEKNQNDLKIEKAKAEDNKTFRWKELIFGGLISAGGIIAGKCVEGAINEHQTNKILRFEETGTVASQPGRSWVSSLFRKH